MKQSEEKLSSSTTKISISPSSSAKSENKFVPEFMAKVKEKETKKRMEEQQQKLMAKHSSSFSGPPTSTPAWMQKLKSPNPTRPASRRPSMPIRNHSNEDVPPSPHLDEPDQSIRKSAVRRASLGAGSTLGSEAQPEWMQKFQQIGMKAEEHVIEHYEQPKEVAPPKQEPPELLKKFEQMRKS